MYLNFDFQVVQKFYKQIPIRIIEIVAFATRHVSVAHVELQIRRI
jgi:hypothetical protein